MMGGPAIRPVLWTCLLASTLTLSVGGFSVGMHVPMLLGACLLLRRPPDVRLQRVRGAVQVVVLIGVVHLLWTLAASPCQDLWLKSLMSFALMVLLVAAIARLAAAHPARRLIDDLKTITVLVIVSVLIELILGRKGSGDELFRVGGIFSEPSHLALAMTPVLVGLMNARDSADRLWGWGGFAVLALLSASTTLFLMVAICQVCALLARSQTRISSSNVFRMLAVMAVLAVILLYSPYSENFERRIVGLGQIGSEADLSALVYVNGWQTAIANLQSTSGAGLGFNRMGCEPRPETEVGLILELLQLEDQNYNDGSFILAKLLSELGLLGLLAWTSALGVLVRLTLTKRYASMKQLSPEILALLVSGIAIVSVGAVIRSTNYFSGPFVFGVFCIFYAMAHGASNGARATTTIERQRTADAQGSKNA